MALSAIGKNSTEEFFETFTYMLTQEASRDTIKSFVSAIDEEENPILREATESALQIAAMQGIFLIIRYEEEMINKIFGMGGTMIASLVAYAKFQKTRLFGKKGRKLSKMLNFIGGDSKEAIDTASLISGLVDNYTHARSSQNTSGAVVQSVFSARGNIVQKEHTSMSLAKGMSEQYTNSLLFKLMTSTFNVNDETRLKKVLGKGSGADVNIDDLNKIGSFLFVKDEQGNVTGLSEQFFTLVNGLGYVHNK